MTPEELENLFRLDVEDTDTDDPLWSSEEVYSYMDNAQKIFSRETDYFSDVTTPEITQIDFLAGDEFVKVDSRITLIRGARLSSSSKDIEPITHSNMDIALYTADAYSSSFSNTNWTTATGTPAYIVTDMEHNKLRLVPIPVEDDTLKLHVYRLPLESLTEDSSDFEIEEDEYQRGLLFYMKYLAYMKNDSDAYSSALSDKSFSLWNNFIETSKRYLRRQRFSSTKGTIRYGGL